MRVRRTKTVDQIVKDAEDHLKYLRAVSRRVARRTPRGRVKQSVELTLARTLKLRKQAKALASSRRKLATIEARIAKRIGQMKRKRWGKVKKRRSRVKKQ